jgi:CubicO group peptidase (beta-lactamase class C family)
MTRRQIAILRVAALAVTLGSILIFAPWQHGLYYFKPLPDTVQAQLDDAIDHGLDGIVVYIEERGQEPEFYASGWHDRNAKVPARPDALFKIGSIGKLYDAAAVAKLAARGTLSLDATVADYLPAVKTHIAYADQVTVRMLVQHRSGIPNYTDQEGFSWDKAIYTDDNLALVWDLPPDFQPGSDYSYSNTNYLLLKRIMSRVLGYGYTRFMEQELLTPLGLQHTFFAMDGVNREELMSGYYVGYDVDFKELAQGYVASAEDVGLFVRALNDGTLFSETERETYASLYEFEHKGWVIGYASAARYSKERDTVMVQFVNTTGGDTEMLTNIVADRVMQILQNRAPRVLKVSK